MAAHLHGLVVGFRVSDADESEFKAVVVFAEITGPTDERLHRGALHVSHACLGCTESSRALVRTMGV